MDTKSPFFTHFEYLISNFFIPISFLWQMQKITFTFLPSVFEPITYWLLVVIILFDIAFWVMRDLKENLTLPKTYEGYSIYLAYMTYTMMSGFMFICESYRQPFSVSSTLALLTFVLMFVKFDIFKRIVKKEF